jgi:lipopolysaccharide transport system ATP-binding protein
MSDLAVRVENLGKQYTIGEGRSGSYSTLRDRIADGFGAPWRMLAARRGRRAAGSVREKPRDDTFWALDGVSFDVRRGEVVGVIGRNGAGKSTLLKILSRITEPTTGFADIYGRVGSLLEVGTGFHPELTGRENIFLNGAILGMHRAEIAARFDEIVAFSEIGRFIDTPVKHYSSGMYLRLAFAVAAHLEPEILVVDEVLAVGDASFQKKCIDKMGEVARGGRTVIFVSHNLSAVLRLCSKAIWLDGGHVTAIGTAASIVERYLTAETPSSAERLWQADEAAPGTAPPPFRPVAVRLRDARGAVTDVFSSSQDFAIEVEYELGAPAREFRVHVKLQSSMGDMLFISSDRDDPELYERHQLRPPGHYVSRCHIPANLLNRGAYVVGVSATSLHSGQLFADQYTLRFTVDVTDGVGTQWPWDRNGYFRPALRWDIEAYGEGAPHPAATRGSDGIAPAAGPSDMLDRHYTDRIGVTSGGRP